MEYSNIQAKNIRIFEPKIFEYLSQKYSNICIRSTVVLRIYSYSVQNMIPNIFVFVFVLKRTFRIYSYSVQKNIRYALSYCSCSCSCCCDRVKTKSIPCPTWTELLSLDWSLTKSFATLGPTWEFQLSLKSCNIASWTTKWHNSVKGTTHHPSWKSFIYVT